MLIYPLSLRFYDPIISQNKMRVRTVNTCQEWNLVEVRVS